MNTSAISRMLGVSSSTVQRWVKHLGLKMERNEFGHYLYSEEDIQILKEFKQQLQDGIPFQDIQVTKKVRRGSRNMQKTDEQDQSFLERLKVVERKVESKADSVVSYQLLQHRREIEDLKKEIESLNSQIKELVEKTKQVEEDQTDSTEPILVTRKRKKIFLSLLGF
ncbi:MerR family transcriptional regulator [Robertmurraya yapensis]|uniref:Chromosome-anchoring protein RacA n=3 Tax=Bacillales TaxID=1385 RepID=A0A3S0JTR9_9BACI|nr:MerR family transcriptional regulator [Bacillus yapensis]RTR28781.1 MerR family transcriptional regulator [Bacillus yapensis]TKS94639.1 MerR family transcriptional regulator [Bacillus yapensis]